MDLESEITDELQRRLPYIARAAANAIRSGTSGISISINGSINGWKIEQLTKSKGLELSEVGRQAGIERQTIWWIAEHGGTRYAHAAAIAAVLNVDICEIYSIDVHY